MVLRKLKTLWLLDKLFGRFSSYFLSRRASLPELVYILQLELPM